MAKKHAVLELALALLGILTALCLLNGQRWMAVAPTALLISGLTLYRNHTGEITWADLGFGRTWWMLAAGIMLLTLANPWHPFIGYAIMAAGETATFTFFRSRCQIIFGDDWAITWTAFFFAICHLPNPLLLLTALLGGHLIGLLLQRYRNIFPALILLTVSGILLSLIVPPGWMRVGRSFWQLFSTTN